MKPLNKIAVLVFGNPERLPPSLNVINELATHFNEVHVWCVQSQKPSWKFPSNVIIHWIGDYTKYDDGFNTLYRIKIYIKLFFSCLHVFLHFKYIHVVNHIAALFAYIASKIIFLRNPFIWYHSHDALENSGQKESFLAVLYRRLECNFFKQLDLFTLPALERRKYYCENENVKFVHLPNYPSLKTYSKFKRESKQTTKWKLIYQGTVSGGHGLKEIADYVKSKNKLELHIAGPCRGGFLNKIGIDTRETLFYHNLLPYSELPKLTSSCHIGIAVNEPKGIIYQTGGTASNKIYEYAACGLPILYYDHEHYHSYLSKYEWAFATDLSQESLEQCISKIMGNYSALSQKARADFENTLNFESQFEQVTKYFNKTKS